MKLPYSWTCACPVRQLWRNKVQGYKEQGTKTKNSLLRTTGYEDRFTVVLNAKVNGAKLQPMVIFKGKRKSLEILWELNDSNEGLAPFSMEYLQGQTASRCVPKKYATATWSLCRQGARLCFRGQIYVRISHLKKSTGSCGTTGLFKGLSPTQRLTICALLPRQNVLAGLNQEHYHKICRITIAIDRSEDLSDQKMETLLEMFTGSCMAVQKVKMTCSLTMENRKKSMKAFPCLKTQRMSSVALMPIVCCLI